MRVKQSIRNKPLAQSTIIGMGLGILVALINPGKNIFQAWLAGTIISSICTFCLFAAWKWVGGTRSLGICMGIAVLVRILVGFGLTYALPIWGHEEETPQHGYLYLDAYRRDSDAWALAQSEDSLMAALGKDFVNDQYGGLLTISASVYRSLSGDAHRPVLILLLTTFLPTLGIPFLWDAIRKRWDLKLANLSIWIYALYPESIILSGSQMREPFIIGLSAIAFWGVVEWKHNHRNSLIALIASLACIAIFSYRAAIAIAAMLMLWFWFDNIFPTLNQKWRRLGWIASGAGATLIAILSMDWFINSASWDMYLTEATSGRIQFELEIIGMQWRVPFIILYGLLQPVLPATLTYPTLPLMRGIGIFRALGWYALLPLLLFAFVAIWKSKPQKDRGVFLLFLAGTAIWVLISSIRGGGDQWDNVRYRIIFLVWMSVVCAWAYLQAIQQKSPWLKRIVLLEGIYILVFLQWYFSRFYGMVGRLPFWSMILLLVVIGVMIIAGGLILDHHKQKHLT